MSEKFYDKRVIFKRIFSLLYELCKPSLPYTLHNCHYPNTTTEDDSVIEGSKIIEKISAAGHLFILLKFNKAYHIISTIDTIDTHNTNHNFKKISLNNGLWCLGAANSKLLSKTNNIFSIYDTILSVPDGTPPKKYMPVNVEELQSLFPEFFAYEIINYQLFSSCIEKCAGYLLCQSEYFSLSVNADCLNEFTLLFEDSNPFIPYELVLFAISSNSKKHAFIELYRCMENLYPLPHLRKIFNEGFIKKTNPFEISQKLEDHMRWRPKEDESLREIMAAVPDREKSILKIAKNSTAHKDMNDANFIYKLRNSSVHYRKSLTEMKIKDDEWDGIISGLIQIIKHIYREYSEELNY